MDLSAALQVLRAGGVVAHATETCYGLAADLSNPEAIKKLFEIKKRPTDKPVSALFASIDQAKEYVEWNEAAQKLADESLPGPLTMILPIKENKLSEVYEVPDPSTRSERNLGVRISSHPTAQKLVEEFGKPITTSSANLHGEPNPYTAPELGDICLDEGELPKNDPSRVVQISSEGARQLR